MASVCITYENRFLHTHETILYLIIAVAEDLARMGRLQPEEVAVVQAWKDDWRTSGVGCLDLHLNELGETEGGRAGLLQLLRKVRERVPQYGPQIPAAIGEAANQLPGDVFFIPADGAKVVATTRSLEQLLGKE